MGAGLAACGAGLWLLAPSASPKSPVRVSVVVSPSGALVGTSGAF
jgi:hypothetical protein